VLSKSVRVGFLHTSLLSAKMAFTISQTNESNASWAYLMTGTPQLNLRCHDSLESLPLVLTHAFNSSKPEYLKARAKYLQLPLLRLVMAGQSDERARSAVKQHFLPMWVEAPTNDFASTSPYSSQPYELPASHNNLECLFPTLLRPSGDLDPEGVRLTGVVVVRIAAMDESAVHHSKDFLDSLQLDIGCPDAAWLHSVQWQYNKATGSQQSDGFHSALAQALTLGQGTSFPLLRRGMVLWLLNVKELPTSPPGRDGKKLMQRVAVTLPAPTPLRVLGHACAQAISRPLAVKASTQGDEWMQQLLQYYPGAVSPSLHTLNVYSPAKAARNINCISPGAVPAGLVPVPEAPSTGAAAAAAAAAGSHSPGQGDPHSATSPTSAAGGPTSAPPSEATQGHLSAAWGVPLPAVPQAAPMLSMPSMRRAVTHRIPGLSEQNVTTPASGTLHHAPPYTPVAAMQAWPPMAMHVNAATYCSDDTDNPVEVYRGAGGVKRPRDSAAHLDSLLFCGSSRGGDSSEEQYQGQEPAYKSPCTEERDDFSHLFLANFGGGADGKAAPPSLPQTASFAAHSPLAWLASTSHATLALPEEQS